MVEKSEISLDMNPRYCARIDFRYLGHEDVYSNVTMEWLDEYADEFRIIEKEIEESL